MTSRQKLQKYIPLVKFIANVLGKNSEVVLHDIKNPDNSIVAIENEHISGRKINGPLTDLALKILKDGTYKDQHYICNYKGNSKDNKSLKSSSYFIKDDNDDLIGMICINTDISNILKVKEVLDEFAGLDKEDETKNKNNTELNIFEHLDENVEELIKSVIKDVLSDYPISPERMSFDEKLEVVKKLNEKGIFLLKGGVSEVAKNLKTSETTIYRYISKIK